MRRKYYRFFGGLLHEQEAWLNQMAKRGYRLIRTEKLLYEFEECSPDHVTYCVEFIAHRSNAESGEYRDFLEDMGYRVFFKNSNLSCSVGKLRLRPWAKKGGRIATGASTYDRELLIVEKENDGMPFELHTSCEDKKVYYTYLRNPWLMLVFLFAVFTAVCRSVVFGVSALICLIPVLVYQMQIEKNRRESKIKEW